ncbi:MAG: R3H domain-containing nucleic acid-binding protein [Candidatus Curtissbacteria bacterium]|nr:R3H domain-containing nucleic acid-binding protein [Candidatus Curtissbacteria bacterium]
MAVSKAKKTEKPILDENFVAEQVRQIIEKLGVSATAEVSRVDNSYTVDISSNDSSLLIGKYGVNLDSFQFILAVRIKTLTGEEDFEIFVDIDGWRRQKEDKLKSMALSVAEEVAKSGKPESLFNLKASERRVIHAVLTDHPKVQTISEGEGLDRYLVIKPK